MIRLHEVTREYRTHGELVRVLGPVNLEIPEGQAVAVVGPSGAGKSTLLSVLGLLDRPTRGTYRLGAMDVTELSETQRAEMRRDTIGFVFQRYNLLDELSVVQNVALPLLYRGWSAVKRRDAAQRAINRVGLAGKERLRPSQLSGGEQQRAAIARAVVGRPQVILCDEPTGNLDSNTGRLVMDLLLEIHRDAADSVLVVVTHNRDVAMALDRILVIQDGRVTRAGAPQEVLTR
ncbi:MAG: ABC transporter ATP-binding protein [Clostridia bacterium]|nr:ABC transporter ATP-binding protein [Clostridia bacterium]